MLVAKSRRKIEAGQTGYPPHFERTPRFPIAAGAALREAEKISESADTSKYSSRAPKIIGLYKALHFESSAANPQHRCMFRVTLRTLAYKIVDGDLPACTFDPRTALAARAQKQRFGSTLISG